MDGVTLFDKIVIYSIATFAIAMAIYFGYQDFKDTREFLKS